MQLRLPGIRFRIRAQLMADGTAALVHNHNNRLKLQRVAGFLFLFLLPLLLRCRLPSPQGTQQPST